ncbi:MAG: hypothetical protein ABIA04_05705 [Pseudomonadota bacterium]
MLVRLNKFFRRLRKSRKGQTAIEYALIVGGVSIFAYSMLNSDLMQKVKGGVAGMGDKITSELTAQSKDLK